MAIKPLHQYLAEYFVHKMDEANLNNYHVDDGDFERWMKDGIEAYQSTHNCTITVAGGVCPDCVGKAVPLNYSTVELFDGTGNKIVVGKYECPECGYEIYC